MMDVRIQASFGTKKFICATQLKSFREMEFKESFEEVFVSNVGLKCAFCEILSVLETCLFPETLVEAT